MAARSFYTDDARARVAKLIAEIEAKSAAEVVVMVRASSGHYRHTDLLFGFGLAFVGLLSFLFHPRPMRIDLYAVEHLLTFAIGVLLSAAISPIRRLLTSRRLMRSNVATAARAAFVEQRIGRTSGRTGVLVYVSMFERRAEIVPDIGVDLAPRKEELDRIQLGLNGALRGRLDDFVESMSALGALLAELVPPRANDVDELPNEVVT